MHGCNVAKNATLFWCRFRRRTLRPPPFSSMSRVREIPKWCLSAMMPPMTIMVDGYCMKLELRRGGDYVESGLALDAYRLQRK